MTAGQADARLDGEHSPQRVVLVARTQEDLDACERDQGSAVEVVGRVVLDLAPVDPHPSDLPGVLAKGLRKARGRRLAHTPLPRWLAWSADLDAQLAADGPQSANVDLVIAADAASAKRISRVMRANPEIPLAVGSAGQPQPSASTWPRTDPGLLSAHRQGVRVVQLVEHGIAGDSRVQKESRSLADLGYDSIVLGIDRRRGRGLLTLLDRAVVMLVPVQYPISRRASGRKSKKSQRQAARIAREQSWSRFWSGIESADGEDPGRYWTQIRQPHRQPRLRRRFDPTRNPRSDYRAGPQPIVEELVSAGAPDWELALEASERWPWLQDVECPLGQMIERLQPDVIHANDATLLGVAARTAARMRAAGWPVAVVYDAHEWTNGLERQQGKLEALQLAERAHIHDADVVLTVSETIADRLVDEYDLPQRPFVVTNAPVAQWQMPARGDVRSELGLAEDVPLLVYLGGIAPARGVDLVVEALPMLPGVHLVVGTPPKPAMDELMEQAALLGVADRVHRVDYVEPDEVPAYISTATAGVIPFRAHINSDLALPTKMREYIHGGLPVLCSDRGESGELLRATGIGETFVTDDALDLARAAKVLLGDPARYQAKITEELRTEHSWEQQVLRLAAAYEQVSPRAVAPPAPDPGERSLVIGPGVGPAPAALASELRASGQPAVALQVVAPDEAADDGEPTVLVSDWRRPEVRIELLQEYVRPASFVLLSATRPVLDLREMRTPATVSAHAAVRDALQLGRTGRQVGLLVTASELELVTPEFLEAFSGTIFAGDEETAAALPEAAPGAALVGSDPGAAAEAVAAWIAR